MYKYLWKFTMGTTTEPTWEVFKYYNYNKPFDGKNKYLVGYAKRAKDDGWFVRVSGFNEELKAEKLYIGDDVFPPDFMKMMLEMHKNDNP